jgi:site-specific DNA-methyltransferase (adenine-specific)
MSHLLHAGDCLQILPTLAASSADAVVTDPPYHLTSASRNGSARVPGNDPAGRHRNGDKGFMGKTWDGGDIAFRAETWAAIGRVLKPGGYLLAFGGPRTFHRIACAIEDGGFVLVDTLAWLYGQGFPKHTSKLKPAWEPIILAWKPARRATPLPGLDACRIECAGGSPSIGRRESSVKSGKHPGNPGMKDGTEKPVLTNRITFETFTAPHEGEKLGRWPANVILDEEAGAQLDLQTGPQKSGGTPFNGRKAAKTKNAYGPFNGEENPQGIGASAGHVSRFFYCAKASRKERNAGCEDLAKEMRWSAGDQSPGTFQADGTDKFAHNHHPTVKPLALMRYLCRLVTPAGGLILDPFLGSGSTGIASLQEGFRFVGIEEDRAYLKIARRRIRRAV